MSSYFVVGFGAFASSSPQRTFKTSSKTVSGALPPSATLMYGRLPAESITWMSHGDYLAQVPEGFQLVAHTDACPTLFGMP